MNPFDSAHVHGKDGAILGSMKVCLETEEFVEKGGQPIECEDAQQHG
jgi:hypothetical protein